MVGSFFSRSTAKKFLAAANFLEVLKIFPKTPISESVRASLFTSLLYIHLIAVHSPKKR